MIDIRKLKELVRLMVANDLTEMDLRDSEEQVTIRRPSVFDTPVVQQVTAPPQPAATASANNAAAPTANASTSAPASSTDSGAGLASGGGGDDGLVAIESPMVGTFYTQADPSSPTFVNVGDHVGPDTVVCLVEAMKIFNEIKADISGTIEKVNVKTGEPVEFGEALFMVRPD